MSKLTLSAIGHLGHSCTIKNVNGVNAINFSIACTEKYKDKSGNNCEKTTWVDCTIWRKPESSKIADYLKKGTMVYVEGRPDVRGYKSKTNADQIHGVLMLRVDEIQLLSKGTGTTTQENTTAAAQTTSNNLNDESATFTAATQEDDLPF